MTPPFLKKIILAGVILGGWSLGSLAYAAQVTFTTVPATPAAGKEFSIVATLHTQKDSLNVVEGAISIPKGLTVERVSTGGSGLSLWPVEPHFIVGSGNVEFTGGVPGGIVSNTDTQLFTIVAKAIHPDTYTLQASLHGFRNDGKGTKVAITASPYQIAVASQSSAPQHIQQDTIPPQFVSVEVGSDPALFDGRLYLTFFATDDMSGVSYYEVKEGFFGSYTRADRFYVLSDQSRSTTLWVRAVDAAGNSAVKEIPSQHTDRLPLYIIGGILVGLLAVLFFWYLRRRA